MTPEKIDSAHFLESMYLVYVHNLNQVRLRLGELSEFKKIIDDLEKNLEEKSNAGIKNHE